jgi:hypothetical protein
VVSAARRRHCSMRERMFSMLCWSIWRVTPNVRHFNVRLGWRFQDLRRSVKRSEQGDAKAVGRLEVPLPPHGLAPCSHAYLSSVRCLGPVSIVSPFFILPGDSQPARWANIVAPRSRDHRSRDYVMFVQRSKRLLFLSMGIPALAAG